MKLLLLALFSVTVIADCYDPANYQKYRDKTYTHQDYFEFFKKWTEIYSNGKLDIAYTKEQGFHNIAK